MNYTLQQLKYLIAVADAAALLLYVLQLVVSAAISHLEEEFGIKCFVRHHAKGVTLTAARNEAFVNSTVESSRQFDSNAFRWTRETRTESFEPRFSLTDTIRPEIVGTA